jgi:hypothetical protein
MYWLLALTAGLVTVVPGIVAGTGLAYVWFGCRGATEREGRRGLLAGTVGVPLGAIGGFGLGWQGAWMVVDGGGGAWRPFCAGALLAVPTATVLGIAALGLGTAWAKRRGVTNYAGERAAWALYRVALPTVVLAGCGAFALGFWWAGSA